VPPDLIVYFGDLNWRSVGSVGHGTVWTHENDTGPDDANHAQLGMAIFADVGRRTTDDGPPTTDAATVDGPSSVVRGQYRAGMSIYYITPTILRAFGIEPPAGMGRTAISLDPADSVYSAEEEAEIARRLEDL